VSGRSRTTTLRVRYAETDQMGVVYHTHYLVWCEIGRTDFIRQLGVSYAELERQGLFLAVAEATIRYAGSARYDDPIRVETWLDSVQSRMIGFRYEIARDGAGAPRRLATASTKLVALDRGGAPRALPPDLLDRFRALLQADAR
jgi:acyl-CoA thioester hydrolase